MSPSVSLSKLLGKGDWSILPKKGTGDTDAVVRISCSLMRFSDILIFVISDKGKTDVPFSWQISQALEV